MQAGLQFTAVAKFSSRRARNACGWSLSVGSVVSGDWGWDCPSASAATFSHSSLFKMLGWCTSPSLSSFVSSIYCHRLLTLTFTQHPWSHGQMNPHCWEPFDRAQADGFILQVTLERRRKRDRVNIHWSLTEQHMFSCISSHWILTITPGGNSISTLQERKIRSWSDKECGKKRSWTYTSPMTPDCLSKLMAS